MHKLIKIIFIASCVVLSGCAGRPLLDPVPEIAKKEGGVLVRSTLLDKTDHMTRHLNKDKNILYFQNFGGGGAALGLLGPLGVAANMKMIESNTEDDVKLFSDKLDTDPVKMFTEAAVQVSYSIDSATQGRPTKFSPYLYVVKVQEDKLLVAAAMIVDVDMADKKWTGRYMYQLPLIYTAETLSKADKQASSELSKHLILGFSELIKTFKTENPEAIKNEKPITFKSEFVFPRFDLEMRGALIAESNDRAWIRTVGAVYSLAKSEVKIFRQ